MRPIDADALIEKCGGWYVDECTESGFIGTLKDLLATEPTIQPEKAQLSQEGATKDAISRQQALDAVGKYASVWMEYTDAMSKDEIAQIALNNAKSAMIRILKELPTVQPEPKWIPVKREVPEIPGYYITSSEYGGVTVDFYYDHFWNARKNAYKVLAWMPLPKIYKPNK